jgi:hypothetical protein
MLRKAKVHVPCDFTILRTLKYSISIEDAAVKYKPIKSVIKLMKVTAPCDFILQNAQPTTFDQQIMGGIPLGISLKRSVS